MNPIPEEFSTLVADIKYAILGPSQTGRSWPAGLETAKMAKLAARFGLWLDVGTFVARRYVMDEADYWWDQAAKLRERAKAARDRKLRQELLDQAAVCEEVAANIEARAPGG
ncbi:MAG: hypothetical protein KGL11_12165 [Alphaproteobacteria bacterium]|nr:hypothetical protein [Alphaproteobacteria bacterium]